MTLPSEAVRAKVEFTPRLAHTLAMSGSIQPRTKVAPTKRTLTYRGVKLQSPAVRSQFTVAQIKKAVEDAIAKNPDVITSVK